MSSKEALMTTLAYDDTGGTGRLVVLLPGAGDLRSEHRFIIGPLSESGFRVITADLPGHGNSPTAAEYTVRSTARALLDLIENAGGGPAVVIACSFAPAAAVWAAVDRPELIDGIVALSPHFEGDDSFKGRLVNLAIKGSLRGPWAANMWAKLYAAWYKTNPPADLGVEIEKMKDMLSDPLRRKAVRETLTAGRDGVSERMERVDVPTLVVFGSADDHFADPAGEAEVIARRLGGTSLVVEGAGHYPHVEQSDIVVTAIRSFLGH